MAKSFELETLKIYMADPKLATVDLHLQIQQALRHLILEQILMPQAKLPGTRALAKSLGVARDTVETAYIQLQRDGYITRHTGAGSFVSDRLGAKLRGLQRRQASLHTRQRTLPALEQELSQRGAQILTGGGMTDQQIVKAFATGLPETRSFPVGIWERIERQVMRQHRHHILLHGDPQGAEPLRKAIASYLNLQRGAKVNSHQVVILSSTRQALFLCAQLLVDAGKSIYMEEPGYFGAHKSLQAAETHIIPIAVDEHGLRIDLLRADKRGAKCVYITPSHQYPTGVTLSLERRLELIRWADENSGWIIEDDYDSEFHYDGLPTACIQGLDQFQRTIYIGTFSKTLYPGLRIGYMVLPDRLVQPMVCARTILDGHTPQILQLTLARFMDDGHYNAHVKAMRKVYKMRREFILTMIETHLDGIVSAALPPGGLQVACLLNEGWSESATITYAATVGIQLAGLSRLYLSTAKKQGWLLGFASLTPHEIEAAILKLAAVLNRHRQHCYQQPNTHH